MTTASTPTAGDLASPLDGAARLAAGLYLAAWTVPAAGVVSVLGGLGAAGRYGVVLATTLTAVAAGYHAVPGRVVTGLGRTPTAWVLPVLPLVGGGLLGLVGPRVVGPSAGPAVAAAGAAVASVGTLVGLAGTVVTRNRRVRAVRARSRTVLTAAAGLPTGTRRRRRVLGLGLAGLGSVAFVAGLLKVGGTPRVVGYLGQVVVPAALGLVGTTDGGGPTRLTVTEEALLVASRSSAVAVPWGQVTGVERRADAVVVRRRWGPAVRLATADLGDVSALVEAVRERAGTPPRARHPAGR